jgi:hypothetical protein
MHPMHDRWSAARRVILPRWGTAFSCSTLGIATAHAQTPSFIPAGGVAGCDFASGRVTADCIPMFLAHIIQTIFGFTGAICLIMILISGYQFALGSVTGGDTSAAKERLKWAIIGMIVSALAFYIIDFVISSLAGT